MGNGLTRSEFEKMAGSGVVEEFDATHQPSIYIEDNGNGTVTITVRSAGKMERSSITMPAADWKAIALPESLRDHERN